MSSSSTSSSRRSTPPSYSGPVDATAAAAASCYYDVSRSTCTRCHHGFALARHRCGGMGRSADSSCGSSGLCQGMCPLGPFLCDTYHDHQPRNVESELTDSIPFLLLLLSQHISFLVRDGDLERACHIVADERHLPPVGSHPLQVFQLGDLHTKAQHFDITPNLDPEHPQSRRLSLFPLSWASFVDDELQPAPLRLSRWRPNALEVLMVSPASICASLVRLHGQTWHGSAMATTIHCDLATVLYHSLFDTSYEGDYMELKGNEPLTEEEQEDITAALEKFRSWHFRDEELWIPDALEAIVAGRGYYDYLPSLAILK